MATLPDRLMPTPAPGTLLGGRYRVESLIGGGGMGVVLAAFDERLGRSVALKLLDPERSASQTRRHRFLREARAAAKITSEYVVRVYDAGVFDDAGAYLAMDRLEGMDLRQALNGRGRFSSVEAVEILLQTCRAVAAAHEEGIIHRDLKPANIFLVGSPQGTRIKVLDFGISKMTEEEDTGEISLTETGSAVGSPRYMSPEQVRDAKRVGPATDIWALGVIFYELLTGTPPFDAETAPGIYARIVADPARPPRELRSDVPPSLEAICMRCLEKRIEARFPDVAALAHALLATSGDAPAAPTVTHADGGESTLDPMSASAPGARLPKVTRAEMRTSTRAKKAYIAAGAAASFGFIAYSLLGLPSRPPETSDVASASTTGRAGLAGSGAPPAPFSANEDHPDGGASDEETRAASAPALPIDTAVIAEPTSAGEPQSPASSGSARRVKRAASGAAPSASTSPSSAQPTRCDPPFLIDPTTGTRRVKRGC